MEGPLEFVQGIRKGTRHLFGSVVGGTAGALSKVTDAASKGLATLTLDQNYQNLRIQRKELGVPTGSNLLSTGKHTAKVISYFIPFFLIQMKSLGYYQRCQRYRKETGSRCKRKWGRRFCKRSRKRCSWSRWKTYKWSCSFNNDITGFYSKVFQIINFVFIEFDI